MTTGPALPPSLSLSISREQNDNIFHRSLSLSLEREGEGAERWDPDGYSSEYYTNTPGRNGTERNGTERKGKERMIEAEGEMRRRAGLGQVGGGGGWGEPFYTSQATNTSTRALMTANNLKYEFV